MLINSSKSSPSIEAILKFFIDLYHKIFNFNSRPRHPLSNTGIRISTVQAGTSKTDDNIFLHHVRWLHVSITLKKE
uniref:CSON014270 protein n=1 Tax=Culicoides sonorensis TaxID=179676 RepID=A0A336MMH5_CULSO